MAGRKKIFVTRLTDTSTTDDEGVGTIRWESSKAYQWVLFNHGAGSVAAAAGAACYNYAISGASTGSTTVCSDITDSGKIGRGVFQAVIANGSYGWIQIKGQATMTVALAAGSDGGAITAVGAGDGDFDVSGAVTDAVIGFIDDVTAKIVILDCPFV